ncbi:MAG TPA: pseudouridine synthase [Kofleriaceae bacterium]|jgi:23S rRNA pseudouridine1911/1915/1917 synthase|nr:pseudouridine synthase [Kofleriaceae bacterium]
MIPTTPPPSDSEPDVDEGVASHLDEHGKPRIIERHLIVPPELAGLRLDHFVKTQIVRLSRTKIQMIIDTQLRRVGPRSGAERGVAVSVPKPATIVTAGDHFVIRREAKPEPPCPRTFGVVHSDARVIVVDKPAGLPVHASAKFYFNTLARVLAERYPDEPELQLCHRLDRETSGCLVVARDKAAAAFVKQAISNKHATTKQYLAIVNGHPPWDRESVLDVSLRISTEADDTKLATVRVIAGDGGLEAITRVHVERRSGPYALVRCTLVTGRQHQIRAHLAHAGFPIVGDKIYAHGDDAFIEYCDEGLSPELAELFVLPRHALHAAAISVPHPDGGRVTAAAPLPADMAALLHE